MRLKAQDNVVDPDEGALVVGIQEKSATTVAKSDISLDHAGHLEVEQRDKVLIEHILEPSRKAITSPVWTMQVFVTRHVLVSLENVLSRVELRLSGVGCVESGGTITVLATPMERMKRKLRQAMVMDMLQSSRNLQKTLPLHLVHSHGCLRLDLSDFGVSFHIRPERVWKCQTNRVR